jgi:hypothetical protein
MTIDGSDALSCKIECQELIIRHGAALDHGNASEGIALFVEGTKVIGGPGRGDISLEQYWDRPVEDFTYYSPRIITNIVITPTGTDTAEGIAYVTMRDIPDSLWRYKFLKTDQGWRISVRTEEFIANPPHIRHIQTMLAAKK